MAKSVLVYCWRGCNPIKNFGEWFCRLTLEYLGYDIHYFACHMRYPGEPVMLIVGSNFHRKMMKRLLSGSDEVRIWGQGNGWGPDHAIDPQDPIYENRIKVFALRGPITAQQSDISGVPLCDPGFLIPRCFSVPRKLRKSTYYVPHHSDRELAKEQKQKLGLDSYIDVFMPWNSVKPTVHHLAHAEFVLTGSLHTMILCLSYGVPCAKFVSPSCKLPEPQRWDDLFASMGAAAPNPVENTIEGREWWEETGSKLILPDSQKLVDSFPHHLYR